MVGGFIKAGLCLLAAANGLAKIFNFPNYRSIVTSVALLTANFTYLVYEDVAEMVQWSVKVWPWYALPFQVILPLLILIWAEVKKRQTQNN
ncbi:hypothetical protein JOC37_001177 [Desulfohalotomaculum tongense]|uniref:hypothetical protein n=1 Tax=Desulforadius tongensis TaxID=1216062 RepID=UPI001958CDEB|nr:hypothetical protein [Desulforadius tongensis]MBM7854799.1 hypothetical protein [Desulforadius tongensis]